MMKVILDTDIGTDVDDAFALALCLASPEIELVGVTIVNGDVELRGRIARKMLRLANRPVPVAIGRGRPILGRERPAWGGHEGVGLLDDPEEDCSELRYEAAARRSASWRIPRRSIPATARERPRGRGPTSSHAVDFLIDIAARWPEEVTVVTIGPMTNLALALVKEPALAKTLRGVVSMGGAIRGPQCGYYAPPIEHNVRSDPEAAKIVFESGVPLTLVPLDVTLRTGVDADDLRALASSSSELHRRLAAMLERWFEVLGQRWAPMHDPLAVAALIDPPVVTLRPMALDVVTEGQYRGLVVWSSGTRSRVAVDLDAPRFHALLRSRLGIETNDRMTE